MSQNRKNQKWHIFHTRHRPPFYVALYTGAMAFGPRRVLDFNYHGHLFHINGQVAMPKNEMSSCRRRTISRFDKDNSFLLKMMAVSYRDYKNFLPLWKKISKLQFKKLSNKELSVWLKKYIKSINDFWSIGLVPLYVEDVFVDELKRFVGQRLSPKDAATALQVLLLPLKESVIGIEYRKILKIAVLPERLRAPAIHKHWQEFAWLANQLYTHTFYPRDYFFNRLRKFVKQNPSKLLESYLSERIQHRREYNYWLNRLKPNKRMRLLIDSLNEAIYYRSWRGERPYQSEWIVAPMMEEISRRLKIRMNDLLFCLPKEVVAWLESGTTVLFSKIHSRQSGFVYLPYKPEKFLTGLAVKKWERELSVDSNVGQTKISGQTAFAGHAVGRVCVVLRNSEFGKVKRGDILVTGSTTPAYVPILNKVKAIVTDEGGVLSHASVISRELKIPCIIGTKNATKVLKDGDSVQVDAEKGIVKIVSK